jgi:parallel beta-helix repeat protein
MRRITYFLPIIASVCFLIAACAPGRVVREAPPRQNLDIQALLDSMPNGSILTINYGEYIFPTGLKLANKNNVTLSAAPGTRIFVDDVMEDVLGVDNCDSVRIENLHLRHLKPLTEYQCEGACLRISQSRDVEVAGCELDGCGAFGIAGTNLSGLRVTKCYVHDNSYSGFYFMESENVLITGNRIVHNMDVMSQYSCAGIEMRDNQLK